MNQRIKRVIIVVSIIISAILILLVCGLLGYMNDPRFAASAHPGTASVSPKTKVPLIKLNYCYGNAPSVCVVSFGQDSANNSLAIIRNDNTTLKEFYLKINQAESSKLTMCQQVQFSNDVYYCSITHLQEGTEATIDVYSAKDNRLIASGLVTVAFGATPLPNFTSTPQQNPQMTATRPALTQVPTHASTQIATTDTPAYPNP